jgi:hypothetical protein
VACQSDRGSSFTTGGGFSNIYSRPSWQDKSHDEYFASVSHDLPYINASIGSTGYFPFARYNRMGRGYPDISVIGESAFYSYNVLYKLSIIKAVDFQLFATINCSYLRLITAFYCLVRWHVMSVPCYHLLASPQTP